MNNKINEIYDFIRGNGSRPKPPTTSNPNHTKINLTFAKPYRGMRELTQDVDEMGAIVDRIKNVSLGPTIDPAMRHLIKQLNSETNKELCKKLEGTYILSLF